jgi:signal transduction histidine kinase
VEEYEDAIDMAIVRADVVLSRFTALLRIAEIDAGGRRAKFGDVHLDALVRDVAELYEPVAEAQRITMRVMTPSPVRVHGDVDLLFGAVENLLDNALKYTPAGGSVVLETLAQTDAGGARPTLRVADNGPGIAIDERAAVLRPFYRSVNPHESTPVGHGLGLSLVAAIARVHGAALDICDNRPGCRVELRFTGEAAGASA